MDELISSHWNAEVRYQAHAWPQDALVLHCERLPSLAPSSVEAVSYALFQQVSVPDERSENIASAKFRYSHLQDLCPERFSSSRNDEILDRCARRAAARKKLRREETLMNSRFSQSSIASSPEDGANIRHFPALRPSGLHCRSAQAYEVAPRLKP